MIVGCSKRGTALLVFAVLLILSRSVGAADVARPARISLSPPSDASAEQVLRAAIFSIDTYVRQKKSDAQENSSDKILREVLSRVDPMDLKEAARVLKNDKSEGGDFRRRRALLQLLAWVRGDPKAKEAVKILVGAKKAEEIYHALALDRRAGACDDPDPQDEVNAVLAIQLGPVNYKSCTNVVGKYGTVVSKGENIGISAQVTAEGSVVTARQGLDAQSWHRCSTLWAQSYLVDVDPVTGQVRDNGKCAKPDAKDCLAAQGQPVLPLGETYNTSTFVPVRPLFENFVCDALPCDVRLMLHINSYRAPWATPVPVSTLAYSVDYDDPTQWQNFPYPPVDYGRVVLMAKDLAGGTSELTAKSEKTFGFPNWTTNAVIYFALHKIEMENYLADLVCCVPPPP